MSNLTEQIRKVELGAGGPLVGIQGFGAMGISVGYGPTDAVAARDTLEATVEAGVTLIDTADAYGHGANEEFLAPFVAAHRDEITLATKFAFESLADGSGYTGIRNDRAYIKKAVEGSLRRLNVDVIDLYYMHRRDPAIPFAESVGAMAELVREGKVKYLGLSEVTGAELREAHAVHPITALQSEWSLFSRNVERSVVGAAAALGVALVSYSPLGRAFLAGTFTDTSTLTGSDFRHFVPRFAGDNAKANAALLTPLQKIAADHGATMGQIALAWVQQRAGEHGLTVVPIPGTRRRSRLLENAAATRIVLTVDELALLEPIAGKVAGDRYSDMSATSEAREA